MVNLAKIVAIWNLLFRASQMTAFEDSVGFHVEAFRFTKKSVLRKLHMGL